MTFAVIETSVDDGRPIELLKVSCQTGQWCYTTAEDQVVHDGLAYEPMPMSHSSINPSSDVAKTTVTFKVPQDCPIGELFRVQPPSGVVTVTLFTKHVDDPEVKTRWKGRIVNAEWAIPWLELTSESVYSSMQRLGLRRKFSTQCTLSLYSQGEGMCNVDREAVKQVYEVAALSGLTVACPGAVGKPWSYFAGGFANWVNVYTGRTEERMIVDSDVSGNLTLTSRAPGLIVGSIITAYPGCDHSLDICDQRFDNSLNHGGTPFIPKKNPFGGSTIY